MPTNDPHKQFRRDYARYKQRQIVWGLWLLGAGLVLMVLVAVVGR